MGVYTGRNAKVTFGTTEIADCVEYTMRIDNDLLREKVFGNNGWATTAGSAGLEASGSMSGLINTADTDGQVYLENACISGTKVTNFRLYVNPTDYWASNTGADADAGVYFGNYEVTANAGDIVRFTCEFSFDGHVYGDPLAERSQFDIYSTRLKLKKLGNVLTITAGRQNILSGFSYDLIDGLDILVRPDFVLGIEA